eukprot:CAMPEP_0184336688 /NCGR_PEP_ID=MMETSP1089-20130417/4871_1 /TAXON_ID=38269 ORGANISM="Gloeochaete wittrockiana, Strain SAG46.84" /NCGR_SAMPLE_ID=MMETSP1089 /ASSEMBLY_ACC=CAM_ASM_000445 /LENGTH=3900 /DNA_ID=CAMNT_0026661741 /DNA_START=309 /DNA_END=12011 /DNA_ORIENTATION=+
MTQQAVLTAADSVVQAILSAVAASNVQIFAVVTNPSGLNPKDTDSVCVGLTSTTVSGATYVSFLPPYSGRSFLDTIGPILPINRSSVDSVTIGSAVAMYSDSTGVNVGIIKSVLLGIVGTSSVQTGVVSVTSMSGTIALVVDVTGDVLSYSASLVTTLKIGSFGPYAATWDPPTLTATVTSLTLGNLVSALTNSSTPSLAIPPDVIDDASSLNIATLAIMFTPELWISFTTAPSSTPRRIATAFVLDSITLNGTLSSAGAFVGDWSISSDVSIGETSVSGSAIITGSASANPKGTLSFPGGTPFSSLLSVVSPNLDIPSTVDSQLASYSGFPPLSQYLATPVTQANLRWPSATATADGLDLIGAPSIDTIALIEGVFTLTRIDSLRVTVGVPSTTQAVGVAYTGRFAIGVTVPGLDGSVSWSAATGASAEVIFDEPSPAINFGDSLLLFNQTIDVFYSLVVQRPYDLPDPLDYGSVGVDFIRADWDRVTTQLAGLSVRATVPSDLALRVTILPGVLTLTNVSFTTTVDLSSPQRITSVAYTASGTLLLASHSPSLQFPLSISQSQSLGRLSASVTFSPSSASPNITTVLKGLDSGNSGASLVTTFSSILPRQLQPIAPTVFSGAVTGLDLHWPVPNLKARLPPLSYVLLHTKFRPTPLPLLGGVVILQDCELAVNISVGHSNFTDSVNDVVSYALGYSLVSSVDIWNTAVDPPVFITQGTCTLSQAPGGTTEARCSFDDPTTIPSLNTMLTQLGYTPSNLADILPSGLLTPSSSSSSTLSSSTLAYFAFGWSSPSEVGSISLPIILPPTLSLNVVPGLYVAQNLSFAADVSTSANVHVLPTETPFPSLDLDLDDTLPGELNDPPIARRRRSLLWDGEEKAKIPTSEVEVKRRKLLAVQQRSNWPGIGQSEISLPDLEIGFHISGNVVVNASSLALVLSRPPGQDIASATLDLISPASMKEVADSIEAGLFARTFKDMPLELPSDALIAPLLVSSLKVVYENSGAKSVHLQASFPAASTFTFAALPNTSLSSLVVTLILTEQPPSWTPGYTITGRATILNIDSPLTIVKSGDTVTGVIHTATLPARALLPLFSSTTAPSLPFISVDLLTFTVTQVAFAWGPTSCLLPPSTFNITAEADDAATVFVINPNTTLAPPPVGFPNRCSLALFEVTLKHDAQTLPSVPLFDNLVLSSLSTVGLTYSLPRLGSTTYDIGFTLTANLVIGGSTTSSAEPLSIPVTIEQSPKAGSIIVMTSTSPLTTSYDFTETIALFDQYVQGSSPSVESALLAALPSELVTVLTDFAGLGLSVQAVNGLFDTNGALKSISIKTSLSLTSNVPVLASFSIQDIALFAVFDLVPTFRPRLYFEASIPFPLASTHLSVPVPLEVYQTVHPSAPTPVPPCGPVPRTDLLGTLDFTSLSLPGGGGAVVFSLGQVLAAATDDGNAAAAGVIASELVSDFAALVPIRLFRVTSDVVVKAVVLEWATYAGDAHSTLRRLAAQVDMGINNTAQLVNRLVGLRDLTLFLNTTVDPTGPNLSLKGYSFKSLLTVGYQNRSFVAPIQLDKESCHALKGSGPVDDPNATIGLVLDGFSAVTTGGLTLTVPAQLPQPNSWLNAPLNSISLEFTNQGSSSSLKTLTSLAQISRTVSLVPDDALTLHLTSLRLFIDIIPAVSASFSFKGNAIFGSVGTMGVSIDGSSASDASGTLTPSLSPVKISDFVDNFGSGLWAQRFNLPDEFPSSVKRTFADLHVESGYLNFNDDVGLNRVGAVVTLSAPSNHVTLVPNALTLSSPLTLAVENVKTATGQGQFTEIAYGLSGSLTIGSSATVDVSLFREVGGELKGNMSSATTGLTIGEVLDIAVGVAGGSSELGGLPVELSALDYLNIEVTSLHLIWGQQPQAQRLVRVSAGGTATPSQTFSLYGDLLELQKVSFAADVDYSVTPPQVGFTVTGELAIAPDSDTSYLVPISLVQDPITKTLSASAALPSSGLVTRVSNGSVTALVTAPSLGEVLNLLNGIGENLTLPASNFPQPGTLGEIPLHRLDFIFHQSASPFVTDINLVVRDDPTPALPLSDHMFLGKFVGTVSITDLTAPFPTVGLDIVGQLLFGSNVTDATDSLGSVIGSISYHPPLPVALSYPVSAADIEPYLLDVTLSPPLAGPFLDLLANNTEDLIEFPPTLYDYSRLADIPITTISATFDQSKGMDFISLTVSDHLFSTTLFAPTTTLDHFLITINLGLPPVLSNVAFTLTSTLSLSGKQYDCDIVKDPIGGALAFAHVQSPSPPTLNTAIASLGLASGVTAASIPWPGDIFSAATVETLGSIAVTAVKVDWLESGALSTIELQGRVPGSFNFMENHYTLTDVTIGVELSMPFGLSTTAFYINGSVTIDVIPPVTTEIFIKAPPGSGDAVAYVPVSNSSLSSSRRRRGLLQSGSTPNVGSLSEGLGGTAIDVNAVFGTTGFQPVLQQSASVLKLTWKTVNGISNLDKTIVAFAADVQKVTFDKLSQASPIPGLTLQRNPDGTYDYQFDIGFDFILGSASVRLELQAGSDGTYYFEGSSPLITIGDVLSGLGLGRAVKLDTVGPFVSGILSFGFQDLVMSFSYGSGGKIFRFSGTPTGLDSIFKAVEAVYATGGRQEGFALGVAMSPADILQSIGSIFGVSGAPSFPLPVKNQGVLYVSDGAKLDFSRPEIQFLNHGRARRRSLRAAAVVATMPNPAGLANEGFQFIAGIGKSLAQDGVSRFLNDNVFKTNADLRVIAVPGSPFILSIVVSKFSFAGMNFKTAELQLIVDATQVGIGLKVSVDLPISSSRLTFSGRFALTIGPAVTISLEAALIGVWHKAFGIDPVHMGDMHLEISINLAAPLLPSSLGAGAKVWIGRTSDCFNPPDVTRSPLPNSCIFASFDGGIDLVDPARSYFDFQLSKLTLETICATFLRIDARSLPGFIRETGFPRGLRFAFAAKSSQWGPKRVEKGLIFDGELNILNIIDVSAFIKLSSDGFQLKVATRPLNLVDGVFSMSAGSCGVSTGDVPCCRDANNCNIGPAVELDVEPGNSARPFYLALTGRVSVLELFNLDGLVEISDKRFFVQLSRVEFFIFMADIAIEAKRTSGAAFYNQFMISGTIALTSGPFLAVIQFAAKAVKALLNLGVKALRKASDALQDAKDELTKAERAICDIHKCDIVDCDFFICAIVNAPTNGACALACAAAYPVLEAAKVLLSGAQAIMDAVGAIMEGVADILEKVEDIPPIALLEAYFEAKLDLAFLGGEATLCIKAGVIPLPKSGPINPDGRRAFDNCISGNWRSSIGLRRHRSLLASNDPSERIGNVLFDHMAGSKKDKYREQIGQVIGPPVFNVLAASRYDLECDASLTSRLTSSRDGDTATMKAGLRAEGCDRLTLVSKDAAFTPQCSVSFKRTWTAKELCTGQETQYVQTISITDRTPPDAILPANFVSDISVQCHNMPYVPPVVLFRDSCSGNIIRSVFTSTDVVPKGCKRRVYKNSWKGIDTCGNSRVVEQTVRVLDNDAPNFLTFPKNAVVKQFEAFGTEALGWPTARDTCNSNPITITYVDNVAQAPGTGDCLTNRTIARVWTVKDACGNLRSRTQTILIVQTERMGGEASLYHAIVPLGKAVARDIVVGGQVAVGGDIARFDYFSLGRSTCSYTNTTLLTQAFMELYNGSYYNGDAQYGATQLAYAVLPKYRPVFVPNPIDWNAVKTKLYQLSASLQAASASGFDKGPRKIVCYDPDTNPLGCTYDYGAGAGTSSSVEGTITRAGTSVLLSGGNPLYNVFSISAADLLGGSSAMTISTPQSSQVVVNVQGSLISGTTRRISVTGNSVNFILWNFAPANSLTLSTPPGFPLPGTLLAPAAAVTLSSFANQGQVIARVLSATSTRIGCPIYVGSRLCTDVARPAVP